MAILIILFIDNYTEDVKMLQQSMFYDLICKPIWQI